MKKLILTTTAVLVFSLLIPAQTQTQFTHWDAVFSTIKTGKKTSLHTDVQWRSTDNIKNTQTLLLRPGINFHLNKKIILSAGYAYISSRTTRGSITDYLPEHRLWEQLIINHNIKKVITSHRFRLEQRFLPRTIVGPTNLEIDGFVLAGRLRYFVRNILPLKKQETFKKGMFAALQNEVFVNVVDKYKVNGKFFDQNRLYLAAGYRLSDKADLEIGYMNQYVNGSGSRITNNHIFQLAGYLRL